MKENEPKGSEEMHLDLDEIRVDTCYHEAAHAVFDYHAHLPIRYVFVTEELDGLCVSGYPIEPQWWQGLELAAGILSGEYAVWKRHGEIRPDRPFSEFVVDAEEAEEEAESLGEEYDSDDVRALRMLRLAANAPNSLWGDLENCYRLACKKAVRDVEFWWPEICAVAERLLEVGYLEGDDVIHLIESEIYGEEE